MNYDIEWRESDLELVVLASFYDADGNERKIGIGRGQSITECYKSLAINLCESICEDYNETN